MESSGLHLRCHSGYCDGVKRPTVAQLVAFDFAFCALFVVIAGPPAIAVALALRELSALTTWWVAVGLAPAFAIAYLFGLTAMTRLARALVPALKPGSYRFPSHKMARAWLFHFALQRILYWPVWRPILFSIATLRTAALRSLGMKVPMAISTGSDPQLLDPNLVEIGEGAIIGADVMTTCHWILGGRLQLAALRIGADAQLHEGAKLAPGVTVGDGAVIGAESHIGPGCQIDDRARIGPSVSLLGDVEVGRGAKIGPFVTIERGVRIGRRAVITAGAYVPEGTVIAEEAVFPPNAAGS
jgi:acetyltransferase-like isoleucine patch superfamily enzyme